MIVHVNKTGTGFKGTVLYLLYGPLDALNPDRVEWIESRNLPTSNALAAERIMSATARDSGSKQAPVYHISISFDPGDPVDRAIMIQVADRLLRDLDLEEHQALIVSHRDRAHPHLHLVVNRVHPERLTVWSNWYDFPRIERSLRAQEVELGLRVVPGRNAIVPHSAELRPQPRLHRGDAAFLCEVQEHAGPVLQRAQSWDELERDLAAVGLSVRVNGRGMSVTDGEQVVKASEIDRAFSRNHLEKRLGIYGEYRALLAAPGRAATPPPAQTASEANPASAPPQEDRAGDVIAAGPALEPERLTESAGVELLSSSEPTNLTPLPSSGTDDTRPAAQAAADGPAQLDLLTGADDSQVRRDDVRAPHPVLADQLDQARGPAQLDLPLPPETPHLRPEIALQDAPRTSASAPAQGELTLLYGTPAAPKSPRSSRDQQHASARPVAPARPAEPLQESPPARPAPSHSSLPAQPPALAPVRPPDRPPTERERYRDARRSFGRALAKVYVDPHTARRAFALHAYRRGRDEAVTRLQFEPERLGQLRSDSRGEDAAVAGRVGSLYAMYHLDRARTGLIPSTVRLRAAAEAESVDQQIRHAYSLAEEVQREYDRLRNLERKISGADGLLRDAASQIYRRPEEALSSLWDRHESLRKGQDGHPLQRMLKELKERPELLGPLSPGRDGILARLREVAGGGDFSAAREQVHMLAAYFNYRVELGEPPSQAQVLDAAAKAAAAWEAVETAENIRRTISDQTVPSLLRSVAPDLRRVLRKVGKTELERKVSAMLPASAMQVAMDAIRTAMRLAEGPEREEEVWDL